MLLLLGSFQRLTLNMQLQHWFEVLLTLMIQRKMCLKISLHSLLQSLHAKSGKELEVEMEIALFNVPFIHSSGLLLICNSLYRNHVIIYFQWHEMLWFIKDVFDGT